MTRKIDVRVREDDLRRVIEAGYDWFASLADAAIGEGYHKPDAETMKDARTGMASAERLRAALPRKFKSGDLDDDDGDLAFDMRRPHTP